MFADWKHAWREAVENFERELRSSDDGADHGSAMRRELSAARGALARLDADIERAVAEATTERDAEQVCIRRQTLAQDINDDETVKIAGEYAVRHAERASIYERKADVLRDERALLMRDIESMEAEVAARAEDGTLSIEDELDDMLSRPGLDPQEDRDALDRQARELARERRERAANEKLEELKRRMQK